MASDADMQPKAQAETFPTDAAGGSEPKPLLEKVPPDDVTVWGLVPGVLEMWLPMFGAFVLSIVTEAVNTMVIGSLGDPAALAGVGLANMMQNCLGMSLVYGLASGMDTFVSQAHGAGDIALTAHYAQRCRAIVTLMLVWTYPVLYYSGSVLTWMDQDPLVAQHAGAYNRASLWGLVAFMQFSVARQYLQNRHDVSAAFRITLVTTLLHPIWSIYFVHSCQLGNAGAGYANSVTWWLQYVLVMIHVYCSSEKLGLSAWRVLGIEGPGLEGWWSYMEVALPSFLQVSSELWFWEGCSLVVGYVGTDELAAQVSVSNMLSIFVMPCFSLGFAAATLAGTAIGEGSAMKAKKTLSTVLALDFLFCSVVGLFLLLGGSLACSIYTPDPKVSSLMEPVVHFVAVAVFWDSANVIMGGVLRGVGRTTLAGTTSVVMLWGVGMPLLIVLSPVLRQSFLMLWVGIMAGPFFSCMFFGFVLYHIDYQALVNQAKAELREGEGRPDAKAKAELREGEGRPEAKAEKTV